MQLTSLPQHPAFEIAGVAGGPVVVVLGGISATRHVCSHPLDASPGWWECVAGAGKAIDTSRYQIVSFDFVDGGTRPDGRPACIVTTRDQADALAAVLDTLGVERAHAVIGASYGGMVALAFAEHYPARLETLVVIGAAHHAHPMTTALRSIQRQIVELGISTGRSQEGLTIARALAMTTYRGARAFAERFANDPIESAPAGAPFPVERYLRRRGEQFAASWTAARFLSLSLSADLHRVRPARILAPTLVVAAEGDTVVPREQSDLLVAELGGPARLALLPSSNGHDAFLTEAGHLSPILSQALSRGIAA